MSSISPTIEQLIEALRCLPGVGPRSAQRMSLHLLERDREGARRLAEALEQAVRTVRRCSRCRNLSDTEQCGLCQDTRRDDTQLCVVETPSDVLAIEHSHSFRGRYFVLLGRLSPIDGLGPQELGLDSLRQRVQAEGVTEVILATNPTVEGEATAYYITDLLRPLGVQVSRIAHGVPLGGELEFVDGSTLARAFSGRRAVD
jgi:recombination protein RecR